MSRMLHSSLVLTALIALAASAEAKSPAEKPAAGKSAVPSGTMSKLQAATTLAPMLKRVLPGVVSVLVEGTRELPATVGAGGLVEAVAMREPFRAGGSGVVVDGAKGFILTNNHVVADATSISVVLSDGRGGKAELIGTDVATDVAVLAVSMRNLTVVPYGDSDSLRVGDFVAAVGNPYGLEGSASQGIVSALARSDIGYGIFEDFIQTDAAINPGNSGGALVDIDGRLIGINTASGAQRLRTQGISFAIPINLARAVGEEIVSKGAFKRGSLGLVAEDIGYSMAMDMGLSITRGAEVKAVLDGSPAAQAGIRKSDVIVAIGGKPVRGQVDYVARVATTPIGKSITMTLVRAGSPNRDVRLTVADFPIPPTPEMAPMMSAASLEGLSLGAVLPGFKAFGAVQGARVLALGQGKAARSGLVADDVILKVDMTTVRSPQEVFEAVASRMGRYRLEVWREGKRVWIYGES